MGQPGPSGAPGAQGPAGIVTIASLSAQATSVSGGSLVFTWAAPPATVLIASGQQITGSAVAVLGTPAGVATQVGTGLCHQSSNGPIVNFTGPDYTIVSSISAPTSFPVAATVANLPAGEYKIGFCVRNVSPTALTANGYVSGWVMVTN